MAEAAVHEKTSASGFGVLLALVTFASVEACNGIIGAVAYDYAAPDGGPGDDGDASTADADDAGGDGEVPDASPDAPEPPLPSRCNPTKPFKAPIPVWGMPISDPIPPMFSSDELTLVFSLRIGSWNRIHLSKRAKRTDSFGPPQQIPNLGVPPEHDVTPTISPNGLELVFLRGAHLQIAKRARTDQDFGGPEEIVFGGVRLDWIDRMSLDDAGNLYFGLASSTELPDLWVSKRTDGKFAFPTRVLGVDVNTINAERYPVISPDGLTLFFESSREYLPNQTAHNDSNIWVAKRQGPNHSFEPPVLVTELNDMPRDDHPISASADGCMLYVYKAPASGTGYYEAQRSF